MRRERLVPLLLLLAGLLLPGAARAQWPGELSGRVTDRTAGTPVEGVTVEVPSLARAARTDAAGRYRLRGLEPGEHVVVFRRAGYPTVERTVRLRNGETRGLDLALAPVPVALEALRVTASRDRLAAGTTVAREEIEASGARTAADVVARVPGVTVRGTGPTGAATVSLRGGAPDAVLVLVDGAPLNDPVTGEADLSRLPAHAVERVTVVPGAQTARYGPRAAAGVVLVETRAASARGAARAWAGALGEVALQAEGGGEVGRGAAVSAGAAVREVDGAFDFERDPNDPRIVRRANADLAERSAFAALSARPAGGELRASAGWESLDRGIPGLGFAPSAHARQSMERVRGALAWRRAGAGGSVSVAAGGAWQDVRFADPDPPFGLAYDDRTRAGTLTLRAEGERHLAGAGVTAVGGGFEATRQTVDAPALADGAPAARTDAGLFARAALGRGAGAWTLGLAVEARADRDGASGDLHATHGVTASAARGGLRAQLSHRSAFSPPTLGDQFFREGVGVAPNPDLAAERVPGEWEAGLTAEGRVAGLELAAGATAYRGAVRGMITWLPDYRFVWSPRNTDALRRGGEAWGRAALPAAGVTLTAQWQRGVLTYDRGGGDDTVQVAYRPRHGARLRAAWAGGPWRLELGAAYTGARNTSPSDANPLPGFWSLDAAAARDWRVGRWTVTTALDADRLRGERASLIHGYPEPGRRLRLDVRVRRGRP